MQTGKIQVHNSVKNNGTFESDNIAKADMLNGYITLVYPVDDGKCTDIPDL